MIKTEKAMKFLASFASFVVFFVLLKFQSEKRYYRGVFQIEIFNFAMLMATIIEAFCNSRQITRNGV